MSRFTEQIKNKETGEVLAYRLHTEVDRIRAYRKLGELEDLEEKGELFGKWIPCSERLPETATEVLVTLGHTYESDYTMYSIARFIHFDDCENHWCDNRYGYLEWDKYSDGRGGNSSYRVNAWMPLPEMYKGE